MMLSKTSNTWFDTLVENKYYIEIKDLAESFGVLVALASLCLFVFFEMLRNKGKRSEQKKTARYWIYYHINNRIVQDINIIEVVCKRIQEDQFAEMYAAINSFNAEITSKALSEQLEEKIGKNYYDFRKDIQVLLQGFEGTWKNDDVLTRAITFEFSLLSQTEKQLVLEYFEDYNTLEDRVQMIIPVAGDTREKEFDSAKFFIEEIINFVVYLNHIIGFGLTIVNLLKSRHDLPEFESKLIEHQDRFESHKIQYRSFYDKILSLSKGASNLEARLIEERKKREQYLGELE